MPATIAECQQRSYKALGLRQACEANANNIFSKIVNPGLLKKPSAVITTFPEVRVRYGMEYAQHYRNSFHLSNPKPGHTTGGPGRDGAQRRARTRPGRTGRRRIGPPRRQPTLCPPCTEDQLSCATLRKHEQRKSDVNRFAESKTRTYHGRERAGRGAALPSRTGCRRVVSLRG